MSSDSDSKICTPPGIRKIAEIATRNLLPDKSHKKYNVAYQNIWIGVQMTRSDDGDVTMVVNQISSVLRQAVMTFSCKKDVFHQNMELLKAVLDKTTASDVNLQPQFTTEALWATPGKAPVTYIDIYENQLLTMGIFVLRPGMKLPLHDHPQMYGLIKVIMGKIKITSFSINDENVQRLYANASPLVFTAEKHPDVIADANSETCVLEPHKQNIHEIESLDGPAAFLDVLSPPYDSRYDYNCVRKCSYFKVVEQLTGKLFKLKETGPPNWFWNDTYVYEGPEILHQKKQLFT